MLISIKNKMMAAILRGLEEAKRCHGVPDYIAVSTSELTSLIRELNDCKDFQKTNAKIKIDSESGFNPKFLIYGSALTQDKLEQFVLQIKNKQYSIFIDQIPIIVDDAKSKPKVTTARSKKSKPVKRP